MNKTEIEKVAKENKEFAEYVEEIGIDKVVNALKIVGGMQSILQKEDEFDTAFTRCLGMCSAETQIKYNYLNDLTCECDDAIVECYREIQKAQIDEDLAEEMGQGTVQIEANRRRYVEQQKLKVLEERYDLLLDKLDEMFFVILQNAEQEEVIEELFF